MRIKMSKMISQLAIVLQNSKSHLYDQYKKKELYKPKVLTNISKQRCHSCFVSNTFLTAVQATSKYFYMLLAILGCWMICVLIKTKIYCYTEKQKLEPMLKKHRKKKTKKKNLYSFIGTLTCNWKLVMFCVIAFKSVMKTKIL